MIKKMIQLFCKHTHQHQWREYCQEPDYVYHLITTMRCDRCEKITSKVVSKHDVAVKMAAEGNYLVEVESQDKLVLFGIQKVPMSSFDGLPRA